MPRRPASRRVTRNDPRVGIVSSASLTDALGRRHAHAAHVLDLVSPAPEHVLFGPAVTMRYVPLRADRFDEKRQGFARLFYRAIAKTPRKGAGAVLVVSASGHTHVSVGGGTKLSRLHDRKLAGLITDGRLRDFDELRGYDCSFWCAGATTRWGGDVLMPLAANVPVTLRDVTVFPGDYVFADRAGAVVIPAGEVDRLLDEAVAIERADGQARAAIRREDPRAILRRGSSER